MNAEIDRLAKSGIIEPVEFSDQAAPIVPVVEADGSIRICGDYKVKVNQAAKLDKYHLPWIDDIFASLEGGKIRKRPGGHVRREHTNANTAVSTTSWIWHMHTNK